MNSMPASAEASVVKTRTIEVAEARVNSGKVATFLATLSCAPCKGLSAPEKDWSLATDLPVFSGNGEEI